MKPHSKKIEMLLHDGTPKGLIEVSIPFSFSGKAYHAYRSNIKDLLSLDLPQNLGIYFLIGNNDNFETCVYIGETENLKERIKQHSDKEFWNECIIFIDNSAILNKAYAKFLEHEIYEDLNTTGQVTLMNSQIPTKSYIAYNDEGSMEVFKDNVYLLLGALGFSRLIEPRTKRELGEKNSLEDYEFYLSKKKRVYGKMQPVSGGYKVLEGAKLDPDIEKYQNNKYCRKSYDRREELRNNKIIQKNEKKEEILTKNVIFNSPSGAAEFLLGRIANGPKSWKTEEGKSLREIEEMLLK